MLSLFVLTATKDDHINKTVTAHGAFFLPISPVLGLVGGCRASRYNPGTQRTGQHSGESRSFFLDISAKIPSYRHYMSLAFGIHVRFLDSVSNSIMLDYFFSLLLPGEGPGMIVTDGKYRFHLGHQILNDAKINRYRGKYKQLLFLCFNLLKTSSNLNFKLPVDGKWSKNGFRGFVNPNNLVKDLSRCEDHSWQVQHK